MGSAHLFVEGKLSAMFGENPSIGLGFIKGTR